jgi:hypothetical protein
MWRPITKLDLSEPFTNDQPTIQSQKMVENEPSRFRYLAAERRPHILQAKFCVISLTENLVKSVPELTAWAEIGGVQLHPGHQIPKWLAGGIVFVLDDVRPE